MSPSKYTHPKRKKASVKSPFQICLLEAFAWKIALKYKVKQSKNGTFTSNYKASPINFATQISLRR